MDLTLRIYPDPSLRKAAAPVDTFDHELREFALAMVDMMYNERGIGLAAPQVGVSRRVIIALQMEDVDHDDAEPLVLINPWVVSASGALWDYEEGCLSIPGVSAKILRNRDVEIEYQDLDGETHRVSDNDIFGRILLHEIDHLDGRLFIDYLSEAQKSMVKGPLKELVENRPE